MFDNQEGFIGILPNAYTPEECDRIVAYKNKYKRQDAAAYNTDASNRKNLMDDQSRLSDVHFFRYYDESWIIDKTIKAASKFNDKFCKYNIDWFGLNHEMQLANYDKPGHWFDWHRDLNFHSYDEHKESIEQGKYKRKISAIIQLTDPKEYVGGRLQLGTEQEKLRAEPNDTHQSHLQKGSMLFFPSFVNHMVDKLVSGSRQSFTIWYLGPPWR